MASIALHDDQFCLPESYKRQAHEFVNAKAVGVKWSRAQVEIEEQNSEILQSLNERTSSQLKIQKAVEGLSIIVISYYLFSLFKLGLQSLDALGVAIEPSVAAAVLGPLGLGIIGLLAWRIQRVKNH
jgi:uncharacterized membrane-anchored protein